MYYTILQFTNVIGVSLYITIYLLFVLAVSINQHLNRHLISHDFWQVRYLPRIYICGRHRLLGQC